MATVVGSSGRFPGLLTIRCPEALPESIAEAASRQFTTSSEYTRRALFAQLRADGFDPRYNPGAADFPIIHDKSAGVLAKINGTAVAPPQVGEVISGYQYLGGDYKKQDSWKKVSQ